MLAEVIAIGDELTSGQRLDTNTQWLSQQLGDIGIRTMFHSTVADDLPANQMAFQQAAKRVDIVICTGGLGPTADDLTRQAIAESFKLPLEIDDHSMAHIQQMFESRGRIMPERNRVQAMFPQGSFAIPNPHGTAPGIDLTVTGPRRCRIFALPGVPAEMKEMWEETVRDALLVELGNDVNVVRHHELKCFGTGESALEEMLPDLIRRGRTPTVGITVSKATITLRITAQSQGDAQFAELIKPTVDTIYEKLGSIVFAEGNVELQDVVGEILVERKKRLAVVEVGTGGLVSERLGALEHSDRFFCGGLVVGSRNSAKHLLGVDVGLDAPTYAKELASRIREKFGADYGVAIGEFPDLLRDREGKVNIAFATEAGVDLAPRRFAGHPDIQKERAAKQALDVVRLHLLNDVVGAPDA